MHQVLYMHQSLIKCSQLILLQTAVGLGMDSEDLTPKTMCFLLGQADSKILCLHLKFLVFLKCPPLFPFDENVERSVRRSLYGHPMKPGVNCPLSGARVLGQMKWPHAHGLLSDFRFCLLSWISICVTIDESYHLWEPHFPLPFPSLQPCGWLGNSRRLKT